jgi:hypothetical protein
MLAVGKEGCEPLTRRRDRVRARNADRIEARQTGGLGKRGPKVGRIVQKSRSA